MIVKTHFSILYSMKNKIMSYNNDFWGKKSKKSMFSYLCIIGSNFGHQKDYKEIINMFNIKTVRICTEWLVEKKKKFKKPQKVSHIGGYFAENLNELYAKTSADRCHV